MYDCSYCTIHCVVTSGGYSNSGAQGKDFQKLMFTKKEKELLSRLSLFSPKIMVTSKKKKEKKVLRKNVNRGVSV